MSAKHDLTFTIVGSGLAGGVMANYLGREGYRVNAYEKRPDLRKGGVSAGRSINLALSVRGMHALKEIGVLEHVMQQAVPMPGRMIHGLDSSLKFQPYGTHGEAINSVSRGGLNGILLDAAEQYPNVKLFFGYKCIDVDLDTGETVYERDDGSIERVPGDIVISADGAFSAVRARMQKMDRFDYSQHYLEHGYKELHIPPAEGGGWRMEKNALHIWPRRSYMMIALPNADGSYTVTCFWPFEGPLGFNRLKAPEDVLRHFREHFPDAVPLMPSLTEDYFSNPTGSLVTVRCAPWYWRDKVVILGDAAHAIVPFYGQGMNCAFEDCTELFARTKNCGGNFAAAFSDFYASRKPQADAIADLAVENFIEMRDKVGEPAFLRKKKWEKRLHRWFPNWYTPLYEMISFTRIPYADAVARAKKQDAWVKAAKALLFFFLTMLFFVIIIRFLFP